MKSLFKMFRFVKPYAGQAILAMLLLVGVVVADLLIPRLTQRLIDQGIAQQDMRVIGSTALLMLGAVAMLVKVRDPLQRSLPALSMLAMSLMVAALSEGVVTLASTIRGSRPRTDSSCRPRPWSRNQLRPNQWNRRRSSRRLHLSRQRHCRPW